MDVANDKALEIITDKEAYFIFKEYEEYLLQCIYLDEGNLKVFIPLNSLSVELAYDFLGQLYKNSYIKNTQVFLGDKSCKLDDEYLDRWYYHYALTKEILTEFPRTGILREIIEKYKIKDLQQFREVARIKFSGLLEFNKDWEHYEYHFKFDNKGFIMKRESDKVVFNRFIDYNITVSMSKNIAFINCVFMRNIYILDSSKICLHGCIVNGSVNLRRNVNDPEFSESIIYELHISSANINKLQLSENNILKLIIINSTIENCIWRLIRITFFTTENSDLPKDQINVSYINTKNIKSKSYDNKFLGEKDFFIKFYTYEEHKTKWNGKKNAACLSTVNFLLQNAILGTDKNLISDLKYKKNLYSVKGIKKAYIFLTGGYYKPMRFFLYILLLNSLVFILFTLPFNSFILNDDTKNVVNGLRWGKSIQYCLDLLFSINMFEYTAASVSHIISIIYKFLNTVFVTGFFASILKKYVE